MRSLETVRNVLSAQISGVPEHLDITRCEDGTTAMFILDARCGRVAIYVVDDAPLHFFSSDTRALLLAAITADKIESLGVSI
ncbi:MAG TPA: hypothetical protein VMF03_17785 [Steroidobacteraceae bacterium]|nr:hypothetical protein [Steroidobacteraceae bacterium]